MQKFVAIGLMMLGWFGSAVLAQEAAREVPLLSASAVPLYPRMALAARVQGVVKIHVTTDGRKVSSVEVVSGPPMLVAAAKESILGWQFEAHKPTSFETTFEYVIEEPAECYFSNSVAVLKLPLEVRISTKGLKTCDPAAETKPHQ